MHIEAFAGFARMLALTELDPDHAWHGLDTGGADVNGSVRAQLPNAHWIGLDLGAAPGVDIVADAATWRPWHHGEEYGRFFAGFDIVIATELFEHAAEWRQIIQMMSEVLDKHNDRPELLIATCASIGRHPHGSRGEWGVPEGQHYANVSPEDLADELDKYFLEVTVEYNPNPGDAYAWARGVR